MATRAILRCPQGVFVYNDEVYIADTNNHRIRKVTRNGEIVTIAGNGKEGYNGDNIKATDANICYPKSIFVRNGVIFFSDTLNHRIRTINQDGIISTIAGNGNQGYKGDGEKAINAELNYPIGIYVNTKNEVFIADTDNNTIRKVDSNGIISTVICQKEDGGSEEGEMVLKEPKGIVEDLNGNLFVTDESGILQIDESGRRLTRIVEISKSYGICFNENGELLFTHEDNISKFNLQSKQKSAINAKCSLGSLYSICYYYGEIFVAHYSNNNIVRIRENEYSDNIAGNGEKSFNGDSPNPIVLKKSDRDRILNTNLIGFLPLLRKRIPQFCEKVLCKDVLSKLSETQLEIIQCLIDELIYGKPLCLWRSEFKVLDIISVIVLVQGREFLSTKIELSEQILSDLTRETVPSILEEIDSLLSGQPTFNFLLHKLQQHCIEFIVCELRNDKQAVSLLEHSSVMKHSTSILENMSLQRISYWSAYTVEPAELSKSKLEDLASLYNDESTSDFQIEVKDGQLIHCHRTVLESTGLFSAWLKDSNQSMVKVEETHEIMEIIINYLYGVFNKEYITTELSEEFFVACVKYEIRNLAIISEALLESVAFVNNDNFFEIAELIGEECTKQLLDKLVEYGVENRKELFCDEEQVAKLPNNIKNTILSKISQL